MVDLGVVLGLGLSTLGKCSDREARVRVRLSTLGKCSGREGEGRGRGMVKHLCTIGN